MFYHTLHCISETFRYISESKFVYLRFTQIHLDLLLELRYNVSCLITLLFKLRLQLEQHYAYINKAFVYNLNSATPSSVCDKFISNK